MRDCNLVFWFHFGGDGANRCPFLNTDSMKKICFLLVPVAASLLLSGCFSLMKADHMVYAGSIGKKFDAVVIDSLSRIDTSSSGVDTP